LRARGVAAVIVTTTRVSRLRIHSSAVDERDLKLLELPAILERLCTAAASAPGRDLAARLRPETDASAVVERQARTTEAVWLVDRAEEPELIGFGEIEESIVLAERGAVLEPQALRTIANAARTGVTARRALEAVVEVPLLGAIAAEIDLGLAVLADAIHAAITDDGSDVRDTASPTLRRLRSQLREGRARLADRLRSLARSPGLAEHLAEDFVTERAGRPVIALRASSRSAVPGIVHDTSGSGQTLFVEPLVVVEDSNRLREAESAEREEVIRILRDLSERVSAQAASLQGLVEAVGQIDLALACATVSRAWRGALVTISYKVALRGARHPLLDAAQAVPVDLELGELRAVVISGPNTGGKTVALKTLGLAVVLHQCGLRPPADAVALPIFDRVLVDIGDEQSIAMSLSTFSGHLRNLVAVLEAATGQSLVLLDEVAAGTDPVEGAALAQALLERLTSQARLTVVTSHFAELKEWAAASSDAANAATGFDPDTDRPLYRVEIGRPGTSHALRIAERLGLPTDIVSAARARITPDRLRVADLLTQAEAAERDAAVARAQAIAGKSRVADEHREAERRTVELTEEIERVRRSAHAERERVVAETEKELTEARSELDELRREIRAARKAEQKRRATGTSGATRAERERDRRLGAASDRSARARDALARADTPLEQTAALAVGDPVVAPTVGVRGTVTEIVGDEATVLGPGGLRVRIPLERLRPDRDPVGVIAPAPSVQVPLLAPADAPFELDLRGRTAQESREAVRAFIDNATLAGHAEVRVIHGRGTGAIRKAVRDELSRHPLVGGQTSDSADGATVVTLG
jgi:DNA mismatch repair protein MutS2